MVYKRKRRAKKGSGVLTSVGGKSDGEVAEVGEDDGGCLVFAVEDERTMRKVDDVNPGPAFESLWIQI